MVYEPLRAIRVDVSLHSSETYRSTCPCILANGPTSVRSANAVSRTCPRCAATAPPSMTATRDTAATCVESASSICRRRGRTDCSMTARGPTAAISAIRRLHTGLAGCVTAESTSKMTGSFVQLSARAARRCCSSLESISSISLSDGPNFPHLCL